MKLTFVCATILLIALCMSHPLYGAQTKTEGPEQTLFQSANRERTARGLPPLKWNSALAEAAHWHAQRMAEKNTLSHQFAGEPAMADRASRAGAHYSSLAENVALGPDAENIHAQWMKSPPHRANLLDPQLDSLGVGIVEKNGTMFAVEDFSLAVGQLSLTEQEKLVSGQLQARGLHLLDYTADARRSCPMDNGFAGPHTPSFVLHYATPDLQTLPDMLEQRIKTGNYHSAVVGACAPGSKMGLSLYRIAVLLFE